MAMNKWLFGLDAATLATLLTDYTNCLIAISTTAQEYHIQGRRFRRADIDKVAQMIQEIKQAQKFNSKTRITTTYASFNRIVG